MYSYRNYGYVDWKSNWFFSDWAIFAILRMCANQRLRKECTPRDELYFLFRLIFIHTNFFVFFSSSINVLKKWKWLYFHILNIFFFSNHVFLCARPGSPLKKKKRGIFNFSNDGLLHWNVTFFLTCGEI